MTGAQIVETARSYLGTPFQHQGRLKGHACDCVGLILMVAEELELVDCHYIPFRKYDYTGYSDQPLDAFVHTECCRRLHTISENELQDGDVVTMRVPSVPCHVAIIATANREPSMIHAYASPNMVVENIMDLPWRRRIAGCFRFPERQNNG